MIDLYKNPLMGLIESGLVAAIVFHALNGIRIISVDMWGWANRHQNRLSWVVWILWATAMAGFLPRHLGHVFGAA